MSAIASIASGAALPVADAGRDAGADPVIASFSPIVANGSASVGPDHGPAPLRSNGVAIRRHAAFTLQVRAPVGAPPLTCGGATVPALASAVYVSPRGQDGPDCGSSPSAACATIQQGINNCSGSGCGVLVRYGHYKPTATIALRSGVSVYGSCVFETGANPNYRTVIEANPAPGAPALSASSITSGTTISGLVVIGRDETVAGVASVAMAISASNALTLVNMVLAAGRGGDGAPGQTSQAAAGGAGSSPLDATTGGAGGPSCSPPAGNGGQGADEQSIAITSPCVAWCGCGNSNYPNSLGRSGAPSGSVDGAAGGDRGGVGCGCTNQNGVPDGGSGQPGHAGACATQGGSIGTSLWGSFQGTTWVAGTGGSGGNGSVGSGGGGGGSGGMSALARAFQSALLFPGYPGGGGGGGGCGGLGATGGQQGGASIGLVLVNATLDARSGRNTVVPGPGGRGGAGGVGGVGGAGGPGARGLHGHEQHISQLWVCSADVPGSGGSGGAGGQGGAGAGGAGGNGGASLGLAFLQGSDVTGATAFAVHAPLPGRAGAQGAGGQNAAQPPVQPNPCKAADGAGGAIGGFAHVYDSATPPNNFLLPGQRLAAGQALFAPQRAVQLAMQNDHNLCLYRSGTPLWCSETTGPGSLASAIMRTDGNLCVDDASGNSLWCSNTAPRAGAYLVVFDEGYLAIYVGSDQVWRAP